MESPTEPATGGDLFSLFGGGDEVAGAEVAGSDVQTAIASETTLLDEAAETSFPALPSFEPQRLSVETRADELAVTTDAITASSSFPTPNRLTISRFR